jgi:ATP-dependent Lon protease
VANKKSKTKQMSSKKKTGKKNLVKKESTVKSGGLQKNGKPNDENEIIVTFPEVLPTLPAREMVAFPGVMLSLYVARPGSIAAIDEAQKQQGLLFVVSQKNHNDEEPAISELHKIGVVVHIVRVLSTSDGRYKVLLQGLTRAQAKRIDKKSSGSLNSHIEIIPAGEIKNTKQVTDLIARIRKNIQVMVEQEHLPEEMLLVIEEIEDPAVMSDVILAHYKMDLNIAQSMLEELDPLKRLHFTDKLISDDLKQFQLSEGIRVKAQDEMSNAQREYFLREQIKQIQKELGDADTGVDDLAQIKAALKKAKLSKAAEVEANNQLRRLERMHPEASEYALLRTYLEWIADLPWELKTKDILDIKAAKKILDRDHHGLDKAKDRILEYLSVRKLSPDSKGPILCFVGPPGVGKTSLGRSIAESLGRKFFRISLGGVRDEAEIRGHRRTYVGALPGRIIQGLKQVGSRNPVIVLDELDKVGADFRGDPASALLEVLDPKQNQEFRDHYLNVDFDLSDVLFVATANTLDTIPDALLDRLETIYISGYTLEEKIEISKQYLVPRQREENGLKNHEMKVTDGAIEFLIERYTREAGVRNLEREIGALFRKVAREKVEKKNIINAIGLKDVEKLLGVTKFDPEETEKNAAIGLVRGLAWTIVGGEVMPIECSVAPGTGTLSLTGQLGSVMQESAQAALFYARSNAQKLGLDKAFNTKYDIHIHLPGAATPKDGPSAGVTIVTALVSALSKRRIDANVAMTGEVTLRGNVMAVGGIKEKVLAAIRLGITDIIIPAENEKDLEEVQPELKKKVKFHTVRHVEEVLKLALLDKPKETTGSKSHSKKVRGSSRKTKAISI